MKKYIAIDIGASSGRHFAGWKGQEGLQFEEIYRFANGIIEKNGHLCWDIDALVENVKSGLKACKNKGIEPESAGIDTWGCDFVLLDKDDRILGDVVAYRDNRAQGFVEKVDSIISRKDLYHRTGIQTQVFNTIYQLMSIKENSPELLEKACSFLTVPDYLVFKLTGKKVNEYTNATTTGLVNTNTENWDYELIDRLELPAKIFLNVSEPGKVVGNLLPEVVEEIGFDCQVVLPCSHDTGSAVAALPVLKSDLGANDYPLYISSGTWSLLGTELKETKKDEEALELNYTNEGGYDHSIRFLKNIMGLWMVQSVKKELEKNTGSKIPFDQLDEDAKKATISSIVSCNDEVFLAPKSMIGAIQNFCKEHGMQIPETQGELIKVVYESLAQCYADTILELQKMLNCKFSTLNIIGGGSKSTLLNEITQQKSGLKVITGPGEATAIGNCLVQMIANGEFKNIEEARSYVKKYLVNNQ